MPILPILLGLLVVVVLILALGSVKIIPNNRVGIVEKRFAGKGSVKADSFIALNQEAGYQPDVLRGGIHILAPFQFRVHLAPLVTITQGQIGYVFARDGVPMHPTQTLGAVV